MRPQLISKSIHAILDYPVAISLVALPFLLQLGKTNSLALWLSVGTGIAAFVLTLLTDHKLGVLRIVPYSFHLAVDFGVGVLFLIAPILLQFEGIDLVYYLANALAVLTVVSLHKPEETEEALVNSRISRA